MNRTRRLALAACSALSALFLFGCGGSSTGTLSGTVQYKGKSVNTGTVTIFDSLKQPHQAPIEDGKYTIENLPYGEVRLMVMSPNPAEAGRGDDGGGRDAGGGGDRDKKIKPPKVAPAGGWFPIPKKYGDIEKSDLKTTISAKSNDFPIKLTD